MNSSGFIFLIWKSNISYSAALSYYMGFSFVQQTLIETWITEMKLIFYPLLDFFSALSWHLRKPNTLFNLISTQALQ